MLSGKPGREQALAERAVNRRRQALPRQRYPPRRAYPSRYVAPLPHRMHAITNPLPLPFGLAILLPIQA
jgi:hypothetical protein